MKYTVIIGKDPEGLAAKVNETMGNNPGSVLLGGPSFSVYFEPAERCNVILYAQAALLRDREKIDQ